MKAKWKTRGNKLVIRYRFGHVHIVDYDKPSRLMWITARSQRHADRLTDALHWHSQWRPGFVRETFFESKRKLLLSGVWETL